MKNNFRTTKEAMAKNNEKAAQDIEDALRSEMDYNEKFMAIRTALL